MMFWVVESHEVEQPPYLILEIGITAFSNFILNKKLILKKNLGINLIPVKFLI